MSKGIGKSRRRASRKFRRTLFIESVESRVLLASLSGFVYIDADSDGARGAGELGVPGAVINLTSTDGGGVDLSTLTMSDGSYRFDEVSAGTFRLSERQPAALIDGTDSTTIPGAVVGDDLVTEIVVAESDSFLENNFGERTLLADYFGIGWFFASAPPPRELLRESIALGEQASGDTDLAASIRAGATDVPGDTNQAPVAVDDSFMTTEATVLTVGPASGVLVNDSDPDGDPLTASLITQPTSGTLDLADDGSFIYTPSAGFSGTATFSYQANDATRASNPATVSITVSPAATANTFDIDENSSAGTLVGRLDPEGEVGDPVIFEVDNPNLADELRLAADDHISGDPTAPVVLIEYLDLQCPACAAVHPIVAQLEQDFAGDLLVVRRHLPLQTIHPNAFAAARAAEAADRQGMFLEMVDVLFERQDEWEFSSDPQPFFENFADDLGLALPQFRADMNDPAVESRINRDLAAAQALGATGTPTFFLNGDQIPNFSSVATATPVIQNAVDAVDEVFSLDRRSGEIFVANSNALDFETTPTFNLTVNVTNGVSETINATINLVDVNEAIPTARADSYQVDENDSLNVTADQGVLANDTDDDGDTLIASLANQATNGVASVAGDGSFTYTPNANFSGSDSFLYQVDDGDFTAVATVSITVNPVANSNPTAVDDSYTASEDTPLVVPVQSGVLANDSDPDSGDTLSARLINDAANGTVNLDFDGSFTYTPAANFDGTDSFTYVVEDSLQLSDLATVTITVVDQNSFSVAENSSNGALVGRIDPEGQLGDPVVFEVDDPARASQLALAADDHLSGNAAASVVLIEYIDLQCPACRAIHPVVAQLQSSFADDLLVVRRHLPLTSIHQNAFAAALAAEAAGNQDLFLEMADILFERQDEWEFATDPQPMFESYAGIVGLDLNQWRNDMNDPATAARVNRDANAAAALNLTGTPTFFLNGQQITTPTSVNDFSGLIEAARAAFDDPFTVDRLNGDILVANGSLLDFETTPSFDLTVNVTNGAAETVNAKINLVDVDEAAGEGEAFLADSLFAETVDWLG